MDRKKGEKQTLERFKLRLWLLWLGLFLAVGIGLFLVIRALQVRPVVNVGPGVPEYKRGEIEKTRQLLP